MPEPSWRRLAIVRVWQTYAVTNRVAGLALLTLVAVACTTAPGSTDRTEPAESSQALDRPAATEEIRASLDGGMMPNVVGWDLDELGDGTGLLFRLQGVIGVQATRAIASDAIPAGTIAAQRPAPGTALDEIDGAWTLEVSDGGPVALFEDLPVDVATFAQTLDGFDENELLIRRSMPQGIVYKSDDWLFGLECAAVGAAYRTFLDGSYRTACPELVGYLPVDQVTR